MKIGLMVGDVGGIDEVVAHVRELRESRLGAWFPQLFSLDALALISMVGREVPDIEMGTAVVATYPRHPVLMAQQALTAQAACSGRLTLGIGVSHKFVIEGMLGQSFGRPAHHMAEYLSVLLPLLRTGAVDFQGETFRAKAAVEVPGASVPEVLLAAMGPRMLGLAGGRADGTITWMTGPKTIDSHIAPLLSQAADESGKPPPRLVVGLPVCVTVDVVAARERAAVKLAQYGRVPSYRAMLEREGATGPADVAIVGDEEQVVSQINRLRDCGMTELLALEFGDRDDHARTRRLLSGLV